METLLGKALSDMANIISTRWYAGCGAAGLIIVVWTLLKGSAQDDLLVAFLGGAMMLLGAGGSQHRTFRQSIGHNFTITRPARQFGVISTSLYIAAGICAVAALGRAIFLIA